MARFLGEGIETDVVEQIKARGEIMSRNSRTENDLKYLTQRTGWVRVTSMVNTLSEEELETVDDDKNKYGRVVTKLSGDPSKAKELVLQGGSLRFTDNSFTIRSGVSFDNSATNTGTAYNTTDLYGTEPMPGITGFNIVSKNRFGTIREANVNLNVWSLEDLKLVEKNFFRVGYSCAIEWGHSVYVDNQKNVTTAKLTPNYSTFFDNQTREQLQKKISDFKEKTNYNYDGLIGLISNFSWSLRADGGYDCSIKVISLGDIIASLKANRAMTDFGFLPGDPEEEDKDKLEESVAYARKSPFHLLSYILDKVADKVIKENETISYANVINNLPLPKQSSSTSSRTLTTGFNTYGTAFGAPSASQSNTQKFNADLRGLYATLIYQITQDISKGGLGQHTPGADKLFTGKTYITNRRRLRRNEKANVFYMSLRAFLAFINRFYMLKITDGSAVPRFYTDSKKYNSELPPEPQFRTYRDSNWTAQQYSADPWVVQLPQPAPSRQINGLNVRDLGVQGIQANIYDLVIGIPYILEKLDPFITSDEAEFSVLDFVRAVIDGLERPLGGINDFDITYEEDSGLYAIVDRNKINEISKNELPELDLVGLKTTVTDLTIETKISSKLVSSIAIAAQADSKGYGEILASTVAWNAGFIDRIWPSKSQNFNLQELEKEQKEKKDEIQKEKEKKREAYEKLLEKTYGKLNSNEPEYKEEDWQSLVAESIAYQTEQVNSAVTSTSHPLAGIVPVEIGFRLDGISGLKIGELFTVPDGFLLPGYKQFSYIVTGLEHSIDGGKWMSKIKANPIVYPPKSTVAPSEKPPPPVNTPRQAKTPPVEPPELLPTPAETPPATPQADRLRAVLNELGYYEKGDELSNGGDITKQTADMGIAVARKIKELIPGLKVTFTGGNDKYHQQLTYNSRHKRGTGLDFIITPQTAKNQVVGILQGFAAGNAPNFRYLNEYDNPTIAASGKHFHMSWGPGTEAQSNLTLAQARAKRGEINTFNIT